MTEPTATASAAAATSIMLFGVATGLPADLIFPSFVGALWALRSAAEGGPWARALQVVAGTLFAAWSAVPASLMFAHVVPTAAGVPADMLRYPVAVCLGWGGLALVLGRMERAIGGGGE